MTAKLETIVKMLKPHVGNDNAWRVVNTAMHGYERNWAQTYYHNFDHAMQVTLGLKHFKAAELREILAALFHDVVFLPGVKSGVNEESSAAFLNWNARYEWSEFIPPIVLQNAESLINHTAVAWHLCKDRSPVGSWKHACMDQSLRRVMDCDLLSLAAPYLNLSETKSTSSRKIFLRATRIWQSPKATLKRARCS